MIFPATSCNPNDNTEITVWEAYSEQVVNILDQRIKQIVADSKESLEVKIEELAAQFEDYLHEFEQEVPLPPVDVTNLSRDDLATLKKEMQKLARGPGLRHLLGNLKNMGGRGGVSLGTMNFARKYTAKIYKLFGKKAPADLIRRGIPNAVRPLAKLFKQMEKRFWVVQIVMELLEFCWGLLRTKPKMRKMVKDTIEAVRKGTKPGLLKKKILKIPAQPGMEEILGDVVKSIFHYEGGFEATVDEATREIENRIADWKNERKALKKSRETWSNLLAKLEKLECKMEKNLNVVT